MAKKVTILHSNDIHGDFLKEDVGGKKTGGISLFSGYLNKVRKQEENVIFAIAGDMFRGSVTDRFQFRCHADAKRIDKKTGHGSDRDLSGSHRVHAL